jgi:hypothetical protein
MNEDKAKLVFEYTNEFGGSTRVEKTFDVGVIEEHGTGVFNYIMEQFQGFLKQAEFSEKAVNEIKY